MKKSCLKRVVCIMGPTASGKTNLACNLYEKFHNQLELISVDSTMVYKDFDIGSGKPTTKELAKYPHALISVANPFDADEIYNAKRFCNDANKLINQAHDSGKTPILVGGTMLYFKALQDGLDDLPASCANVRAKVANIIAENGLDYLYNSLQKIDNSWIQNNNIQPNDQQRLSRAMEIYLLTGKGISSFWGQAKPKKYDFLNIGIMPDIAPIGTSRSQLHTLIEQRFLKMLDLGLVAEVKSLLAHPNFSDNLPVMRSVGYRQVIDYLLGKDDFTTMCDKAIAATRQLAKRQITWLRSWDDLNKFDFLDPCLVTKAAKLIDCNN